MSQLFDMLVFTAFKKVSVRTLKIYGLLEDGRTWERLDRGKRCTSINQNIFKINIQLVHKQTKALQ